MPHENMDANQPSNEPPDNTGFTKATPDRDPLQHLRDLIVGPTSDSLQELRQKVDQAEVGAENVSRVLADAVRKSSRSSDDFARALGPTFSRAFKDSVKRDPQALADAISPIMGPAIRRSISEQIRAMIQSMNTAVDHSLTPKGWRWRIESWRTGKSFAEVVMLHTLIYRIEQLLLIDPRTGLLLQSASADNREDDADMVSALLSAIQDFMRDSFVHRKDDGSELKTMDTNELTVWIEHSPTAILASAVRGEPPRSLRLKLQEALEQIQLRHSKLIESFTGDTAELEAIKPMLEDLLESEYVDGKSVDDEPAEVSPAKKFWQQQVVWAVTSTLLLLIIAWGLNAWQSRYFQQLAQILDLPPTATLKARNDVLTITGSARHDWVNQARNRMERLPEFKVLDTSQLVITDSEWVSYLSLLQQEPGIALISAERVGDRYAVRGWWDPLARSPHELLDQVGLNANQVDQEWEPYRTLDPRLALRRLEQHITFPPSVKSVVYDPDTGCIVVRGVASQAFVTKLKETNRLLGMGAPIDTSNLVITQKKP